MSKPKVSPVQTRAAVIELASIDGEARAIDVSLSSTEPATRFFGTEVLVHSPEAIDMSRASAGLPLTVNHSERDPSSPLLPIGRVENVRLDGDKLRGRLEFDAADDFADGIRGKVERGVAPDVSITYRVDSFEGPNSDDQITVTRWTPLAVSVVTMPEDHTVGVGRSLNLEEQQMPEEIEVKPEAAASPSIVEQVKQRSSAGYEAGVQATSDRIKEIIEAGQTLSRSIANADVIADIDELTKLALDTPEMSADQFRSHCLELMGAAGRPVEVKAPRPASEIIEARAHNVGETWQPPGGGATRKGLVVAGDDMLDKASRGMELALYQRAGGEVKREDMEGNQYRGFGLLDAAYECLALANVPTRGMTREQIAKAAIGMRAISPGTAGNTTASFPAVTENVLTKRVHDGYGDAEVTWNRWASTYEVADFRQFTIPRISGHTDLPTVAENAQYVDLTQSDAKESATLVKHGGLFSLTWEAVLADEMGMFNRTATSMGAAAARTVDKKVYAVLTANGNMGDGNPLFDTANHGNDEVSTLLDLPGIVGVRTAMGYQTDEAGNSIGAVLRHIIVAESDRDDADNLAGSEYIPWVEGATPQTTRINTIRGTFQVTATVHLPNGSDFWYGASAMGGTVEVAFLAGNSMPALFQDQGWDVDAMHWKIRHPSVAYAVDWRGLQRRKKTI